MFNAYSLIVLFFLGLAGGSFASVVIHRLHTKERGIFWGRSKCPKCQETLAARDLIPLVSFVINQFKCRFCKERISWHYPILELVMGIAFPLTAFLLMTTGTVDPTKVFWMLPFYLFVTFIFILLSFYDLYFQEVPDVIVLPAIVVSLLVALVGNIHPNSNLIAGIALPLVFFGTLFVASRGQWLGGGDVRIGALMGVLLSWPQILVGLFLGYLLGAVYSLIGLATKKFQRKSHIPFAPFLFAGTYLTLFWGEKMIEWYLSF
ncbi:MAG: prepilin peptidase [Candidatus Peregrinibacteria bacterium]